MIAIIPARGGSKGLPGKNIELLNGKPLIAFSIEAAIQSKNIDRVVVSTDDKEIADISKSYGADIPFLRPKSLAMDNSLAIDTYLFTIEELYRNEGNKIENFIVLLPTSPLRVSADIDKAIDLFFTKNANAVISCTEASHPPDWYKWLDEDSVMHDYFPNSKSLVNRQDLKLAYIPNGAIYIFNYEYLKENRTYYSDKTFAYVMEQIKSVDIDSILDFKFAEFMMRNINECAKQS